MMTGGWRRLVIGSAASMLMGAGTATAFAESPGPAPSGPPSVEAGQPPTESHEASLLPSFDPTKAIYQAVAGFLYGLDTTFTDELSSLWNPLVAGTDNLEGKENVGMLIDNSKLKQMWTISLGIAGGSLLVLLFTVMALMWMAGEFVSSGHELGRYLVNFIFFFILMGASYFLIEQLVNVDNALVGGVNSGVVIELRGLKAFQLINLPDPSAIDDVKALVKAIVGLALMAFVVIELVILFVVYFIRIVALWMLVVLAPFVLALGILPAARGVVVYWFRMLCAVVFMKFVNVLVFMTFVFMGAASNVMVMNVLIVFTMLLFMVMVPSTLMKAVGEPSGAITSARRTGHELALSRPVEIVRNRVMSRRAA
jgi:ABC-type multidrug transport system fused ATPase/permease subunit